MVWTLAAGCQIKCNGTTGEIIGQTGAGIPSHTASEGVLYWDTTNNHLYCNNNGATGWTQIDAGGGSGISEELAIAYAISL